MTKTPAARWILVYDGECPLCNASVRFLMRRDRHGRFWYAARQGAYGAALRASLPEIKDLESMLLICERDGKAERAYIESSGVLMTLRVLGGGWRVLGWLGFALPKFIRDPLYRVVARNRKRILKQKSGGACPLPPEDARKRILA